MEISTTMVKFKFPSSGLMISTPVSQCFKGYVNGHEFKVWIPKSKCIVMDGFFEDKDCNTVIIPKWLFMKGELPEAVQEYDTFIFPMEIPDKDIANASLNC